MLNFVVCLLPMQINMQSVWYERCQSWHVATMLALEVLPVTLLLLPAAQGGLLAAANMYSSVSDQDTNGAWDILSRPSNIAMLLLYMYQYSIVARRAFILHQDFS